MTDQSKIPLPPRKGGPENGGENGNGTSGQTPGQGAGNGASLFERANRTFGLDSFDGGFKPAPVPQGVTGAAPRRTRPAPVAAPVAAPAAAPAPATPAPAPAPESAVRFQQPQSAPAAEPTVPPQPFSAPSAAATTVAETMGEPAPLRPVRFTGPRHEVDRAHLREQGMIEPEGAVTALLEEFRIVKRQILLSARDAQRKGATARAQRVLICSPLPGEGKTFCATNLALAIAAERDSEVLLVDADFAKPSVLSALGLPGGPGLMDALADPSIAVEECVLGTDIPGLWVLPAGNQTTRDSEYLASSRMPEVLERLTRGAPSRIVIFDSPPVLAASPAAELAKHVGQAVLVARADSTGQSAIEDALSLISGCPDIKLLLNDAHFSPSGRRFGTYYGYGG